RAGDVGPVAVLRGIAGAGGRTADHEGARDTVCRTRGALAVAHLGDVALTGDGAADLAGVPRRVLAGLMGAVAAIGGAHEAVAGAGRSRGGQAGGRAGGRPV